jgi:hypothetical protein
MQFTRLPMPTVAESVAAWERAGNVEAPLRITSCWAQRLPALPTGVRNLVITCVRLPSTGDLSALVRLRTLACLDCVILRTIGPLPAALEVLRIGNCGVFGDNDDGSHFAALLPAGLMDLRFDNCIRLAQFPTLPATLINFACFACPLVTRLPPLPATLLELHVIECAALAYLPTLPASLLTLSCVTCPLVTRLPRLPATLQELCANACATLAHLPLLPAGLLQLLCIDCPLLSQLPRLPPALTYIQLNRCPLITLLPPLPSTLTSLDCQDCNVACLPALPPRLRYLSYSVLPLALPPALLRLPDVRPRCLQSIQSLQPLEWKRRLAAQHAADRFAAAQHLPTAALLFL